ncbi:MAG: ABC transporter permease [Bacteroidaceae bacterium]|nr:ABC transporter permease [Bacteroidaceae bacterium]
MEKFLARRLYGRDEGVKGGSRPAIIIATAGIAVGLAVMILTMAVTRGFKDQIRDKVMGFSQHITVTNYRVGMGLIEDPLTCTDSTREALLDQSLIVKVQPYVSKPCIIRTPEAFHGFMLKGIDADYDRTFLNSYMKSGGFPTAQDTVGSNWIVLSKNTAGMLGLEVGSKADVYFMQSQVRMRRLTVTGIYETGFLEYDRMFGISDLGLMQRLNGWDAHEYSGLEIGLTDMRMIDDGYGQVRDVVNRLEESTGDAFLVQTMYDTHSGLFAWLEVLDLNVWIILALMMGIAGFTMISGLLIIIFERTATIGTLKSMGASDKTVRAIFMRLASYIILKGMLIGNIVGVAICLIQQWLHIIPLDPANYYLDSVPMQIGLGWLLLLNLVMFMLSMLMMLMPSAVISRILPSKSIRFE